jgi:DnaJ-class molecular chaperone
MSPGDQAAPGTPGTGDNICPRCGGTGRLGGRAQCPTCNGSGAVAAAELPPSSQEAHPDAGTVVCPACAGSGACGRCQGAGRLLIEYV